MTIISEKSLESFKAILPVTLIITVLCFTIAPVPVGTFLSFIVGAVLLLVGMSLFNLGAQTAMMPIGERIGSYITKSRKLWILVVVSFLIGVFITISEPDLQVLANQVPAVPNMALLISVAAGVGLFLVIALLRMFFSIPLQRILIACYALVFVLAAFVPGDFLAVAFDSGGVTTGPMTVPFIMALGLGISAIRSDKNAGADSFGLVALSSVGPILVVLLLGLIYNAGDTEYAPTVIREVADSRELWLNFTDGASGFPHYAKEVLLALAPIAFFFLVFQQIGLKLSKNSFLRISAGIVYTFLGLVLFLTGVNVGFLPIGYFLGSVLGAYEYGWIIIPIAMLIGYFIVVAEPAVQVLNRQVEEISSGAIPARAMNISLSVGMCVSLGLAMIRLLTGASIFWFLIPGYGAALILSFFVPKIFTAIAFDSGGVASGPMTVTFLLPFAIGVCTARGGDVIRDAFGIVAMVAMTPLITIQVMGFIYKLRLKGAKPPGESEEPTPEDSDVIDFNSGGS
ncbi:MAG: DUF1538 domain-containing protein [Oscillospiraceae bacterium]|jgi:hypothetical protein|nr:DUF1538 domain-containing protein [Oscillospiraceae bacterium]